VHPAKALGLNDMPFDGDTRVTQSNVAGAPIFHAKKIFGRNFSQFCVANYYQTVAGCKQVYCKEQRFIVSIMTDQRCACQLWRTNVFFWLSKHPVLSLSTCRLFFSLPVLIIHWCYPLFCLDIVRNSKSTDTPQSSFVNNLGYFSDVCAGRSFRVHAFCCVVKQIYYAAKIR